MGRGRPVRVVLQVPRGKLDAVLVEVGRAELFVSGTVKHGDSRVFLLCLPILVARVVQPDPDG